MKIALYIPCLTNKPAGLAVCIDSLIKEFQTKKVEIIIFTEEVINEKNSFYDESRINYVEIIPKQLKFFPRILRKIYRLIWINISLSKILITKNIDNFISMTFEAPLFTTKKIRYGIFIHDLTALFYSGKEFLLERIYINLYLNRCINNFNFIFVPSISTASCVLKKFPFLKKEKIKVTSEGFDKKMFYLPKEKEKLDVKRIYDLPKYYFLYTGTLLEHKNLKIVLKAMQNVVNSYPECFLIIVGPATKNEIEKIDNFTARLSILDKIRFLGYVPRNHLRVLMNSSNAFVFPSKSEGFGLSVLEAMASGAYVISSNSTSLPEVLGDTGKLISPNDEISWTIEMNKSLDNKFIVDYCEKKRNEAIQRANLFSWEKTAENILSEIENR